MAQRYNSQTASLWRILAAMLYDTMLVIGCIMVVGFIAVAINGFAAIPAHSWKSWLLSSFMLLTWAGFFVFFWSRQGQTLGMRAWRLVVINQQGKVPSFSRASLRWLCAAVLLAPLGLGLWWRWFDHERRSLYDRLSGTRVVCLKTNPYQQNRRK